MPAQHLTDQALALPFAERADLAEALWKSLHEGLPLSNREEAIAEAIRRDEVMASVRRAIGCE